MNPRCHELPALPAAALRYPDFHPVCRGCTGVPGPERAGPVCHRARARGRRGRRAWRDGAAELAAGAARARGRAGAAWTISRRPAPALPGLGRGSARQHRSDVRGRPGLCPCVRRGSRLRRAPAAAPGGGRSPGPGQTRRRPPRPRFRRGAGSSAGSTLRPPLSKRRSASPITR